MADSKVKSSRSKSTKVNFVLLKQILEGESSENTEVEQQGTIGEGNESDQDDETAEKPKKEKDSSGPTGRYPVLFSKRCKSKSCQTRLSAFPLFSVPEDTEWISDEEDNHKTKKSISNSDEKKKRRRRLSTDSKGLKTGKNQEKEKEVKILDKTKNPDGTRKEFRSEHQLKDTKNPVLQAWIYQKNKLARKIRKEERKVKKAQRAALEEEERLKNERLEQSDKKVSEWFKAKRREAKKAWRQNHPKVSPFDMAIDEPNMNPPPPPEYRVVKSFKSHGSSTFKPRCGSSASSSRVAGMDESIKTNESKDSRVNEDLSKRNDSDSEQIKRKVKNKIINVKSERDSSEVESTKTQKTIKRPKTVHDTQTLTIERPKTAHGAQTLTRKKVPRPKTATTSVTSSKTAQKEERHINKSPTKMQSLNYEEWLKLKREQDKKSVIEKRRELIDSHLDAVIAKLGKQRVENIISPRKQVDTGLKNYNRSSVKSPTPTKKKSSYKWVSGHEVPRPEPQGCDCPEVEHVDDKVSLVHTDNLISYDNGLIALGKLSPASQKKQAVNFCKEVTDKCEDLKPSMDKVLAVLDAEIQKCAKDKKTNKKFPTYKAPSGISTTNATIRSVESENSSETNTLNIPESVESSSASLDDSKDTLSSTHPKSAHPRSARPKQALVANTNLTVEEAKKKILYDMDVLGLCDSDEAVSKNTCSETLEKNDSLTTVRSNYFDYGTDVDSPTMENHVELSSNR